MSGTTTLPPSAVVGSALEAEIQDDIRRLEAKMTSAQRESAHLPSRLESRALVALGGLGLLGAGQVTSWLLQIPVAVNTNTVAQADFALSLLLAAQNGIGQLGTGGRATAFALGCLLVLVLVARQVLVRPSSEEEKAPAPSWPAWAVALTLVFLPFYDFSQIQPAVNFFVGSAVSCGLYAVVVLVQKNEVLQRLFAHFDQRWFGTVIGVAAAALIAAGFLGAPPRWAYLGIVLASCLSVQMLYLGLEGKARADEYAADKSRRAVLYQRLAQERQDQRIRTELRRFIRGENR